MGDIYYFLGFLLTFLNLKIFPELTKIIKTKNWMEAFHKVAKRKPNKSEINNENLKKYHKYEFLIKMNFIWICIGFLSKSWAMFSLLILINFILYKTQILINNKIIFGLIDYIKFSIITLFIAFMVVNHFHLHIDLFKLLINIPN